jgi:hypothetical protein
VTSVQLMREAHMAPVEESRSLAFAGRPELNRFYDPDAARRFEGLAGKVEAPLAPARLEPPRLAPPEAAPNVIVPSLIAPPVITPAAPDERTVAIPAQEPQALAVPETVPLNADDKAPEKTPEPGPASPPAETSAPNGERVASLPVSAPGPDRLEEARTPTPEPAPARPQAFDSELPDSAPPIPRARPKLHIHKRLVRIRRIPPVALQPPENLGFPPPLWPGFDNQFTGTTTRNAGKLTGTRPQ